MIDGGNMERAKRRRVLAIASAGGHWEQLMLLRPSWDGADDVHYATTLAGLGDNVEKSHFHLVPDCNRNSKVAMIRSAAALGLLLLRLRPAIVVTTGALPGLLAIAIARRLGARTIWVDSIANAEEMSLAGRMARKHSDLWLSQWPEVAEAEGALYAGSVL